MSALRGMLDAGMVGATVGPITHTLDARWLMAYAAALGETDARYFDTLGADGPLAHPLFPVCYEWPVAVALRDKTIPAALQPQSVHATHHLVIHRAPRAGDTLHTTARVVHLAPRRSGTLVVSRFETTDAAGAPVSTTDYGSVYRDVGLAGAASDPQRSTAASASGPARAAEWQDSVEIDAGAAWVYTECARIWNPIHTDGAVARRAGLPAPILHGTATLALAVSRIVTRELAGDAGRVRAVAVRFSGMVLMPSRFTVRVQRVATGAMFTAVAPDGSPILSQGVLTT